MGSSGWPEVSQVAPSSPSRVTRLTSAMPSGMCWPVEVSGQRTRRSSGWPSLAENQSCRSVGDQTPILLIQPPALVLLATSGETVTTRAATSGCDAQQVCQDTAQGSLRGQLAAVRPSVVGTGGMAAA